MSDNIIRQEQSKLSRGVIKAKRKALLQRQHHIRQEQFKLTRGEIEAKRNDLIQLPVDELAEMFRILEGRDSEIPVMILSQW